MQRILWLILFSIVLLFDAYLEGYYLLIYYTIWTFILETLFFLCLVLEKYTPRLVSWRKQLFEIIFAPSIVVCVGFWLVIAPRYIHHSKPRNGVLIAVTHGLNAVAMLTEVRGLPHASVWKPVLYTIIYNVFLMLYVGAGGRSMSGNLPYWYAQYNRPMGWIFAFVSVTAVAAVHVTSSLYIWPVKPKSSTQYIV